jgi:hypothetical protein
MCFAAMSSAIYISHMPQDNGLASKIQAQLRDHVFESDPNSPNIKTAFFVLTFGYLHDPTAESTTLTLLNRPGVWCIPLFYHLWPHDLLNLSKTPQAKPFWRALKNLNGEVYDRGDRGDEAQFVQQIASVLRNGPRGEYTVFDSYKFFILSYTKFDSSTIISIILKAPCKVTHDFFQKEWSSNWFQNVTMYSSCKILRCCI